MSEADDHGVIGIGADLEPATLVHAYRHGIFPMPIDHDDVIAWWSPPFRGVLPFDELIISRSLRRSCNRFEITINADFDGVIRACASIDRPGGWINRSIIDAYGRLHDLGYAHSVEVWHEGNLAGGLYGVQIAGLFAGESMFHRVTDASKVALVALVACLRETGAELIDVQWLTEHLATLGVQEVTRREYLEGLDSALLSQARSLASLTTMNNAENQTEYLDRLLWLPTGIT